MKAFNTTKVNPAFKLFVDDRTLLHPDATFELHLAYRPNGSLDAGKYAGFPDHLAVFSVDHIDVLMRAIQRACDGGEGDGLFSASPDGGSWTIERMRGEVRFIRTNPTSGPTFLSEAEAEGLYDQLEELQCYVDSIRHSEVMGAA